MKWSANEIKHSIDGPAAGRSACLERLRRGAVAIDGRFGLGGIVGAGGGCRAEYAPLYLLRVLGIVVTDLPPQSAYREWAARELQRAD